MGLTLSSGTQWCGCEPGAVHGQVTSHERFIKKREPQACAWAWDHADTLQPFHPHCIQLGLCKQFGNNTAPNPAVSSYLLRLSRATRNKKPSAYSYL